MKEHPLYIRILCYLLIAWLVISGLREGRELFIPLSLGILLSFLLMPVSRALEKKRVPRIPAILLSIFLMVLTLSALIFFLSSQFLSFSEEIPMLRDRLNEKFIFIQKYISENYNISEQAQIEWIKEQLAGALSSSGAVFSNLFSATGSFLASVALIPIYIFFFIYYRSKIMGFVKMVTPAEKHEWIEGVMHSTSRVSQKYLTGLLIDIIILSILNSVGFLILGINHAILLGVVAAILNIIPYIGVLIGSIFPIAMALLTHDSVWVAIGALGVCVFVQFLDNNFITPNIVGSAVSINPLATIIALLVGGMIWGVAGMMLFIPFLGMLKVILDNVDSLKPFGYLIGEEHFLKKKKVKFFKINLHPDKEKDPL
jgi:predicted PurR-regulated permease PerM